MSVGPIVLGDLQEGYSRELTRKEVRALYKRCLPLDPLCPTVAEFEYTLSCRLQQTARRAREAAEPAGRDAILIAEGSEQGEKSGGLQGGHACESNGHTQAAASTRETGHGAGVHIGADLACVVQVLVDFARRDLHETPEGEEEEDGLENCPGEKESLAQARAVRPNESHMLCGYRSSQIERLGLTYGSV